MRRLTIAAAVIIAIIVIAAAGFGYWVYHSVHTPHQTFESGRFRKDRKRLDAKTDHRPACRGRHYLELPRDIFVRSFFWRCNKAAGR